MNRRGLIIRLAVAASLTACMALPEVVRWRNRQNSAPVEAAPAPTESSDCVNDPPARLLQSDKRFFVDITDEVHLDFEHVAGPLGTYFLPEINGTGGAFFDFDGDGDLDLLLVNAGRSPKAIGDFPAGTRSQSRLYRRDADGTFADATEESGLIDNGIGVGCAVGDVDNDGDVDVFLSKYGPSRLFENDGTGKFADITELATVSNPDYATCSAFFDYDRDGWLDLIVVNYVADRFYSHNVSCGFPDGRVSYCGPLKFVPNVNRLFHNEGVQFDTDGKSHVRFRDVTVDSGLSQASNNGFSVICADFNGDRWPDIFVANDMQPNRLWINQKNGTFLEEGIIRGVALSAEGRPQAGMGAVLADLDGDGDLDLLSTHLVTEYATFYAADGTGNFVDISRQAQLIEPTAQHNGWGVAAIDLDHDGHVDLAIANGLVVPCHLRFPPHGEEAFQFRTDKIDDPQAFWRAYADQNLLLVNDGTGRFKDASEFGGDFIATLGSARALICADVDNDGDLDLLVTYCGQRARLYRNDVPKRGHWLMVRAMEPQWRRDAYGAEVVVSCAGRKYRRTAQPSSSYLASHDPRLHFGLGPADLYDEILVLWPDGSKETFPGGRVDQSIVIEHGHGISAERSTP